MASERERSVLFNDTLNILFTVIWRQREREVFYLTTHSTYFIYGYMASDHYMVKDHSDSEKGNLLLPHGLLFPNSSKSSFICTIPDRIAHTRPLLHQSWSTGWNKKSYCTEKNKHYQKRAVKQASHTNVNGQCVEICSNFSSATSDVSDTFSRTALSTSFNIPACNNE